jgi:hypothetical protein
LPRMTEASLLERKTGSGMVKWRLHTHFEVDRSIPTRIDGTRRARRPGRDDREGADAASRFMNAALVALKETGTGPCPNPVRHVMWRK